MVAALLCLVLLFFLFDLWRALAKGEIGWGQARRLRSQQPREFWGQLIIWCVFALALAGSLIWYLKNRDWPSFPILHLVTVVLVSTVIIRALLSGRATVGSVSFDRTEEPREYWTLFAGGVLFLALMCMPILLEISGR